MYMNNKTTKKQYLCIDLKSFFASVECVERGLDPWTTRLVVADNERTETTICLAVTPALKKLGVKIETNVVIGKTLTIDELFGDPGKREIVYSLVNEVPWNDDGKLRIAVYSGRKLAAQSSYICKEGSNVISVCFHGEKYNINGICKIDCGRASGE